MKIFDREKKRYEGEKAFIREQGRIKEMSPSEIIEMFSNRWVDCRFISEITMEESPYCKKCSAKKA